MRVFVKDEQGATYECQFNYNKFKCGKCGRGNLYGKTGDRCRVCGCIVVREEITEQMRSNEKVKNRTDETGRAILRGPARAPG